MMHFRPAERADGTGWHYVVGGHPIGYCAEHAPHATEDEARECYAHWQRDHVVRAGEWSWTSCHVKDCKLPAKHGWGVQGDGYTMAVLCDAHDDAEHAIEAMGLSSPAGDRWQS